MRTKISRLDTCFRAVMLVLLGLSTTVSAQTPHLVPAGATSPVTLTFMGEAGDYTRVDGQARGAFFILLQPDDWNGDLVVLLRGGVPAGEPVEPPAGLVPLGVELASTGFGVAIPGYRTNGFSVFDGIIDSRIAEAQFTAHFGKPTDTFLAGFSMSTHILQHHMEQAPGKYAGGLALCGALGGPTLQWEIFVHKRALFDYFFPDVLPGDALSTPTPTLEQFINESAPAIVGAILADPERAIEMTGVEQFHYGFTGDFEELIDAVVQSVALATLGGADLVSKAGGIPVDTTATTYVGSSDDTALNTGIGRFSSDPNAAAYLGYTDPSGTLVRPILELHNTVDPVAPLEPHRAAYLEATDDPDLVLFREVDRFGHCEFTPDELQGAFGDLVVWSKTGVRPAG